MSKMGKFEADVGALEAQIKSADKLYTELIKLEDQAHKARLALTEINPATSPERHSAQAAEVARIEAEITARKQTAAQYQNVLQYSAKHAEYQQRIL